MVSGTKKLEGNIGVFNNLSSLMVSVLPAGSSTQSVQLKVSFFPPLEEAV